MVDSSTMTFDTGSQQQQRSRDLVLTYEKEGSDGDKDKAKQLLLPKSFYNRDGETKERNQPISLVASSEEEGEETCEKTDPFRAIRKLDVSRSNEIIFDQKNADVFKVMLQSKNLAELNDVRVLICSGLTRHQVLFIHDHDVCFESIVEKKTDVNFCENEPTMVDLETSNGEKYAVKFTTTMHAESFVVTYKDCVEKDEEKTASSLSSSTPIFGGGSSSSGISSSGGLSFASLGSSQLSGFTSNAGQQFQGAGKTLFGAGLGGRAGDEDAGVQDNDVYVEPIVQLASVNTTSGEEEEDCYFNQRCKLYRFDSANTKKWKERGVGEMKLLRHRGNGKARLVMRRDQVRKLCANHYLVVQMTLEPFKTNDLTVTWMAFNDVSEGSQPDDALLAAKFKNQTILAEFKEKFDLLKTDQVSGLTPIVQRPPEEGSQAKESMVVGACDPKLAATMKELKF